MLKPKPHQLVAEKWKVDKPKCMLALDMGLGKTMLGARSINVKERTLILCPASLKINWKIELGLWSDVKDITIIKKKSEELPKGPGVTIVNFDLIGSKVKKRAISNYDFSDFDLVIVDESHYLKNPKSIRSKIGAKIIKQAPRAILLTGTPLDRPIDLYVPLFALGALSMRYDAFGMKFCDPKKVYLGTREVWAYRGLSNEQGLKELMAPYVLRMKKEDVLKDLPTKFMKVLALDLPVSRQEKKYNLGTILKDPRPIAFEGLSELIHEQGLRKLPLAINHIKMRLETENKIFVVAKHADVIDTLMEKLEKFNPVKLDGRTKDKQAPVDKFQNDKTCRIFVGQITAAGVGITLTAARRVILVESEWSYKAIAQVVDRCHRIGQKETVYAEILTIHQSIDEQMLHVSLNKKDFSERLLDT